MHIGVFKLLVKSTFLVRSSAVSFTVGSCLYELKIIVNLFIGQSRRTLHDVTGQLLEYPCSYD